MPRTPSKIVRRYTDQEEILDSEIEETFLFGQGVLGTPPEMRTLEEWKTLWARWRAVVMPKALEYRPGTRPFACYVVGEIEPPPLQQDPPKTHHFFQLYVPSQAGSGQWFYRYPEPYQRNETRHLIDLGVVDAEEHRRYRAWMKRRREKAECEYRLEQGLYQ